MTTSSRSSRPPPTSVALDLLLHTLPQWSLVLSLIFGGCCSNAYFLELSTREIPNLGTLITFLHFSSTMLVALPSQIDFPRMRFKRNKVPMYRWMVQVVLYASTSLLNNVAFAFDVPMPVHIIFRSGGLVVNMLMGWLIRGKRYSPLQIISVILVTGGVILSTFSTSPAASAATAATSTSPPPPASSYFLGISLLLLALFLSAIMGIWQELTFAKYGRDNWQESLFYSHFFSLPLLMLRKGDLQREWNLAMASTPTRLFAGSDNFSLAVPSMVPLLALNVVTQLACINGVNRLTSKVSSVAVTLVLVVRKAVSLAISVLLVGGKGGDMQLLTVGALAVGAGTVGYAWASTGGGKAGAVKRDKKDDDNKTTDSAAPTTAVTSAREARPSTQTVKRGTKA